MTKQEIVDKLKTGIYKVTFTKVNGERREMPATLMPDIIALGESVKVHKTNTENPIDFPTKKRKENDAVVSVWCVDKNEWRSFRVDSLISMEQ